MYQSNTFLQTESKGSARIGSGFTLFLRSSVLPTLALWDGYYKGIRIARFNGEFGVIGGILFGWRFPVMGNLACEMRTQELDWDLLPRQRGMCIASDQVAELTSPH